MKLPPAVAKGLKDVYSHTGRTVHAYANGLGSFRYLALRPEENHPEVYQDHKYIGRIDFDKMEVVTGKTEVDIEAISNFGFQVVKAVFGLLVGIVMGVILIGIALTSGVSGRR